MRGIICCLILILSLVSCQVQETTQPSDLSTSTRDPYDNVLSQLSDVMFDVEDRLYRLTAPRQESENFKAPSEVDNHNRRRNYFDQIRDNYKNLQDQIGHSLTSGGMIKMPNILDLNFANKGSRSSLDLSLPFLPLSIKVDAKQKLPTKETSENVDKDPLKLHTPFSDINGNVNLGLGNIFEQGTRITPLENQRDVKPELHKRSSRPVRTSESNRKNANKLESSELLGDSSKIELSQDKAESGVEGRILGDLLFSESTFDKYFRRFLNDHGKWLLDSNILPPKKIIEGIRDVTRNQFTASKSSKSSERKEKSGIKESDLNRHPGSWKEDPERIVLAFTPEGLPLKLKIGSSINKPLKFLHKILYEEKVSLNIPVSTTNGVQTVGNDVLNLGFEDKRMSSRTPLLDLSDSDQLNYLIRTLKKLKHHKH